jgi:hypothetical protein
LELKFTSNKERFNLALKKYWKSLALLLAVLGLSTLFPINVGKPNFFGSFTLCSYAPIATVTMFILALTVYSVVKNRKLLLYGNAALLIVIVVFTGFWVYEAKLPMDSIEMTLTVASFGTREDPYWPSGPANVSSIYFDVTLYNPTSRDIPAFDSENTTIRIDGKFTTPDVKVIYISSREPLKAYSKISNDERYVMFVQNYTNADVWASLLKKDFTFTISGILVVRYYYVPRSLPEYEGRSIVWVSKPYSLSYKYKE